MDIWEKLYLKAKEQYHPEDVTPFVYAHIIQLQFHLSLMRIMLFARLKAKTERSSRDSALKAAAV